MIPAPIAPKFPRHSGPVDKKIIFIGRLTWNKGADLLPGILDLLPGWQAMVVGWGALAPKLQADPRIQWLGALPSPEWTEHVGRGVAVIPSRVPEGAPLVLREFAHWVYPWSLVIYEDSESPSVQWLGGAGPIGSTERVGEGL